MRRRPLALLVALAACSGTTTPAVAPATGPTSEDVVTVVVPAASSFDDPGFHAVVEVSGTVDAAIPAGATIVFSLRDAGRPDATCEAEHPLSGCVTVDWSDSPDRPHVPPGGVFDNHLTVGDRTWFMSESGTLAGRPDPFVPG